MTDDDKSKKVSNPRAPSPPPEVAANEPQRRVYALPQEMVERIVEFQKEKGLPSEVEAVRRLLDEALQHRDDLEKIINRYLARLRAVKIGSEAAKDVLVGHPLVETIQFSRSGVSFVLQDGWRAIITDKGEVTVFDNHHKQWHWHSGYGKGTGPGYMTEEEIPF